MRNRIVLFITLFIFAVFTFFYTKGMQSEEETESLKSWSVPDSEKLVSEIQSEATPSADNVATSYYEKVDQLETYLSSNPGDTTHILRLARLYQEGHQPEKASEWYVKYLELVPDDIQSLLDLANTYGESGNWEKSLVITDRLLLIEPDNGKALYNKAAIHANQGNFAEAKSIWELIVTENSDEEIVGLSQQALNKLADM